MEESAETQYKWNAWFRGWSHPIVITAPNIASAEAQALAYQRSNNVLLCRCTAQDPAAVITARI